MALSAGDRLGPFEILASIGAGGMGEVYRARDTRLDRLVAIKQLHAQHVTRFEQEARAIAAVNHPNICQIYDVGADYLVLEYIEGTPLRGPLPATDAVQIGIQIASALEAAHNRGLLHRDLKPANVIITDSGVKLLDFGIAKLFADSGQDSTRTLPGTVIGTPAYMSPEQAHGRDVDARSEIFSFGALLYEMISGKQAFAGSSVLDVLNAIVQKDPPTLNAPEDLARIVTRCLRKIPSERFQTMTELKTALERCLGPPANRKPSIAVLPFANLSAEKDEYFSDGLAEEIINLLARIPGLKVIARTSAFAFRGKEEDIRRIAGALDVQTILEGSVRRAGNRIRVTAQLISAEDSSHLWSGRYDREMADVFAIQDEIALAIAGALQMTLTGAPYQTREHRPDLSAYDALLKARYHLRKLTPEAITRAQESLREAASLDPGYALPYCELAQYYSSLALFEMQPARDAMPLARAAAKQALAIDPAAPEALAIMAWITAAYDYDWSAAERLFGVVMSRQAVSPEVRLHYGAYLISAGRVDEAIHQMARAVQDDPLNLLNRAILSFCLLAGPQMDAASECRRILELDENYYPAYYRLSILNTQIGNLNEALASARRGHLLAPWHMGLTGQLAGLLHANGDVAEAEIIVQKLGDGSTQGAAQGFVSYHLLCQDIEQAVAWTEKAIEQRDPSIAAFLRFPMAKMIRSSPSWQALANKMNLPEVPATLGPG